ncbi:MAG: UDP-N-acetylglucosamine 1-carboxyvinyltransferase [Bdellovibrionales bacterium]|nr:UDP-N-acetylglucosamine 1-carboxyvinyltransferase [Bdellovibrionales bacterium]
MALDYIEIKGGRRLEGEVQISGAKNAALPALATALLTSKKCVLQNVPDLQDISTMLKILEHFGARSQSFDSTYEIQIENLGSVEAPYDFVRKMRASVLLLGPLLARNGMARISLPGGCAIGVRPIDLHLKAMESMGAVISLQDGYVEARAKKLKGGEFTFGQVTVTGTINSMMAASLADGESRFLNCAKEPEVIFCGELLKSMGAKIEGLGTPTILVKGQTSLSGFSHKLIPDRIESGTYMVAAAMTKGEVLIRQTCPQYLEAVIRALKDSGANVELQSQDDILVKGANEICPLNIVTQPHPGFPTDMQAQFMTYLCLANGESQMMETIFENRFMHVPELMRLGAKITIQGSKATIKGNASLVGAPVMATDLRASASLVLAGLVAKGTTKVHRIYHLDRGYEKMEKKLALLGANIQRVPQA